MSMISGQINELRAMAQLEKSLERPAIARILGDAADTIWQLRDDLQRANAENARLRQEIEVVGTVAYVHGVKQLQAENAKLRELVKSVLVLRHDSVFKWLDAATAEVCGTSFTAQARELGVEVD